MNNRNVVRKLKPAVVLLNGQKGNAAKETTTRDLNLRSDLAYEITILAIVGSGSFLIGILATEFIQKTWSEDLVYAHHSLMGSVPFATIVIYGARADPSESAVLSSIAAVVVSAET